MVSRGSRSFIPRGSHRQPFPTKQQHNQDSLVHWIRYGKAKGLRKTFKVNIRTAPAQHNNFTTLSGFFSSATDFPRLREHFAMFFLYSYPYFNLTFITIMQTLPFTSSSYITRKSDFIAYAYFPSCNFVGAISELSTSHANACLSCVLRILDGIILHCIALHCILLHCLALYSIALYCTWIFTNSDDRIAVR